MNLLEDKLDIISRAYATNILQILERGDESTDRTPDRFGEAMGELLDGYTYTDEMIAEALTQFSQSTGSDAMVIVRDIPFYSLCEHHLLPFFGTVNIGYIPGSTVLGLSKFKRLVDIFAHRLQVQENLTYLIANTLHDHLEPQGVIVVISARHLCMEMRGVEIAGSQTITSSLTGVFNQPEVRAEFYSLLKNGGH